MRVYDIIEKKRNGGELSQQEIDLVVRGYTDGSIPDYQVSALLMAICFVGMTERETTDLTLAIAHSGGTLDIDVGGVRADKHSTGGVGDKTSLVVMPIVASLGLKVAKMSGRGLGHTGGTIDKLSSIEGLRTDLDIKEFALVADRVGLAIVEQTADLAPADKLLYALRDVTATVDSLPLIVSSIMGKKLAAGDDIIVLDVKTGSGAFMKSTCDARLLAETCVAIGRRAGKKMSAFLTDMSVPLGKTIGNSLEVIEAIETLGGGGEPDLKELSLTLASELLFLGGKGERADCRRAAENAISSGAALDKFAAMVEAQGGRKDFVYDVSLFPRASRNLEVRAETEGYIQATDAEEYGKACLSLGAGRMRLGDEIDRSAGIVLHKKRGDFVRKGEVIATLAFNKGDGSEAAQKIVAATVIGGQKPTPSPLIIDRIGTET